MTSKTTFLKTLPVLTVLLAALTACGGGDFVDPGVQTAQADFNATTAAQPGQPGAAIQAPELQADPADIAAAEAAATAAATAAANAAAVAAAMPSVTPVEPALGVVDARTNAAANAVTPAPDCAAEGCSGLRIIDGNAEAYRADAQARDNREQAPTY